MNVLIDVINSIQLPDATCCLIDFNGELMAYCGDDYEWYQDKVKLIKAVDINTMEDVTEQVKSLIAEEVEKRELARQRVIEKRLEDEKTHAECIKDMEEVEKLMESQVFYGDANK